MMQTVSFENCCDFHCWVIRYDKESAFGKTYIKDSLKNSVNLIPLLWQHNHYDPDMIIGIATLEYRDGGVYAYCKLFDKPDLDITKRFLMEKGSVSLSPFVVNVKYDGDNIIHGELIEVSLISDRVDRDEAYFPIMVKQEDECDGKAKDGE